MCLLNLHRISNIFWTSGMLHAQALTWQSSQHSLSIYLRVENYKVVRKWSFHELLPSIYLLATSYSLTRKKNKCLNWNTEYYKALFIQLLFFPPRLPRRP